MADQEKGELFQTKDGKKVDALIHEEIIRDADIDRDQEIVDAVAKRLGFYEKRPKK